MTLAPNDGSTVQSVNAPNSGLQAGKTYHFRLTATNSQGPGTGVDNSFATQAAGQLAQLTVNKFGGGTGTVTSTPAGINCGISCSQSYLSGRVVMLTATPKPGYDFAGWGGDCSGAATVCQLTLGEAKTASAQFTRQTRQLTVANAGGGTVVSTPVGIDCGSTCTAAFALGDSVTLTATPAPGYFLSQWGGACTAAAPTCTVAMDAAKNVAASFARFRRSAWKRALIH